MYSLPQDAYEVQTVFEVIEKYKSVHFEIEELFLQKVKVLREIGGGTEDEIGREEERGELREEEGKREVSCQKREEEGMRVEGGEEKEEGRKEERSEEEKRRKEEEREEGKRMERRMEEEGRRRERRREEDGLDIAEYEKRVREIVDKKKVLMAHLIEMSEIDKLIEKLKELPIQYDENDENLIEKLEEVKQRAELLREEVKEEKNKRGKEELLKIMKKLDENLVYIEEAGKFYELYYSK